MKKIWELYPALTRAILDTHNEVGARHGVQMFWCHDFDHVIRVADCAQKIAEDEHVGRLAGVAALCHNADRILQIMIGLKAREKVDQTIISEMVYGWLNKEPENTFSVEEKPLILHAVLCHDQPNGLDDSDVLVALVDADRVVNIEADVIVRAGQYMGDALRVVDPVHLLDDPTASFKDPKSILRILKENLDWEVEGGFVGIRLPKARELAKSRFAFLRLYLETVIKQREEMGLIPYPTFD